MIKYYRHAHGCGSGCTKSFIKLEGNTVTLVVNSDWMGGKKVHYVLEGEYLPIAEPYGIIQIKSGTNMTTNELFNVNICFDAYIFNSSLPTEWGQHEDKFAIDLYAGGGCYSTSTFQLQLHLNKTIINKFDGFEKVVEFVNGLKYDVCTEDNYVAMKKY